MNGDAKFCFSIANSPLVGMETGIGGQKTRMKIQGALVEPIHYFKRDDTGGIGAQKPSHNLVDRARQVDSECAEHALRVDRYVPCG